MSDIEIKLAQMKEIIERYVLHPYLRKNIVSPIIDEDKLLILISIVEQLDLSPIEQDSYVIAIMLMSIALDTHDHVSNTLDDENSMKTRQLTILAGDYYSGLYYKYLAKVGNIQMIKYLSEGVKTINVHKVTIYSKHQSSVNDVMDSVETIEFALIRQLTDYYKLTNWNPCIAKFLLLKRLIKEKEQYKNSGSSVVLYAIDRSVSDNSQDIQGKIIQQRVIQKCEEYIEIFRKQMIIGLDRIPQINSSLKQRIIGMTTNMIQ